MIRKSVKRFSLRQTRSVCAEIMLKPRVCFSAKTRTAGASPAVSSFLERRQSDGSGDPLLQLRLRRGADLAGSHLAALEDHQGRDRHHAILRRGLRALVDVELHDLD